MAECPLNPSASAQGENNRQGSLHDGPESPSIDIGLSLMALSACAIHLFRVLGVVHETRPIPRAAAAIVLVAIIAGLVPDYRFAIFLFTLYTT